LAVARRLRSVARMRLSNVISRTPAIVVRHARALLFSLLPVAATGCLDRPVVDDLEPQARIITVWDPTRCGHEPHRVVVELEDDRGVQVSRSAPCAIGGVTLDVLTWGIYRGRIYAWTLGPEIRSVATVRLAVDAPIIHWYVDTPR
jgi:hypothetical protein